MTEKFKDGQEFTVTRGPIEIKLRDDFMIRFHDMEKRIDFFRENMNVLSNRLDMAMERIRELEKKSD